MDYNKKIYRIIFCLLAAGGLLFTNPAIAKTKTAAQQSGNIAKVAKNVKNDIRKEEVKKRETIIKEAVAALAQTKKAIEALNKKNKQEALDALAMVTGKLDIIIAREPDLATAPIDVRVETYDLISSVDTIKKTIKTAKELLDDGEVQQARELLMGMVSEIDIVVTSIPLASYSAGIKNVAKLVDEEKYKEAINKLYDLLSTLVITRNIIPLPILRAEEMLKKAEKLAAQKNRTEEENKRLERLLEDTKTQLEISEALGYGNKKEYKKFYKQIDKIREKTANGKFGEGFMDKLKNSLRTFKNKIFSSIKH